MVEYAILVAGTALRSFAGEVNGLASNVNWTYVGYGALMLLVLRVAMWAFRPGR